MKNNGIGIKMYTLAVFKFVKPSRKLIFLNSEVQIRRQRSDFKVKIKKLLFYDI